MITLLLALGKSIGFRTNHRFGAKLTQEFWYHNKQSKINYDIYIKGTMYNITSIIEGYEETL